MSQTLWSVRYVDTKALLPKELTVGRAYFVGDESIIILDSGDGRGPVTYGGKSTIISSAGTPNGFLQEQLNTLSYGMLTFEKAFWDETQYLREKLAYLTDKTDTQLQHLQDLSDKNAEGILYLADVINSQTNRINAMLSILTKAVADIYEMVAGFEADSGTKGGESNADPLDGETITTPAGEWIIEQTYNPDGSMTFELRATKLFVDTLQEGQTLEIGDDTYTVSEITNADGTITLKLIQNEGD